MSSPEARLHVVEGSEAEMKLNVLEAARMAQTFHRDATASIHENLMVGEDRAVNVALSTLLDPEYPSTIFGSPYGAGKSTLLRYIAVMAGIDRDDVAFVPGRPDLTPAKLIGDPQEMVTEEQVGDEEPIKRTMRGNTTAILHKDLAIVLFDEANRGNPRTLTTANTMLASKELEVGGEMHPMNNLQGVYFAINPYESLAHVTPLGGSLVARMSRGAPLGDLEGMPARLRAMRDFVKRPNRIEPLETDLQAIRSAVPKVTIPSDTVAPYLENSTYNTIVEFYKHNIFDADGRTYEQLRSSARVNALTNGRTEVNHDDIKLAVAFKVAAAIIGHQTSGAKYAEAIKLTTENIWRASE